MTNSPQSCSAESSDALRLLAAEDERQSKLHDLLETIREQIRLEIQPENRPDGLFKNIQDAVYAMRGRTRLLDDAAITHALNNADPLAGLEQRFVQVLDGWEEDGSSPAAVSALQYALGCVRDAMHEVNAIQSRIADGRSDSPSPAIASPVVPSRDEERGHTHPRSSAGSEPAMWVWRACVGGVWGTWRQLEQPVDEFKKGPWGFNLDNGTAEVQALYTAVPQGLNTYTEICMNEKCPRGCGIAVEVVRSSVTRPESK